MYATEYVVIIYVFSYRTWAAESRVICQDYHASEWSNAGISCALNCDNIRAAILRLKDLDHMRQFRLLNGESTTLRSVWEKDWSAFNNVDNDIQDKKSYETSVMKDKTHKMNHWTARRNDIADGGGRKDKVLPFMKVFPTTKGIYKLEKELNKMAAESFLENGTCIQLLKKYVQKPTAMLKTIITKCTKRSDNDDFIRKITNILNAHLTDTRFQFTDDMTTMLLKSILGESLNLRQGIFDVGKVIAYIQQSAVRHDKHTRVEDVITLGSARCLNINVPGCFCNKGFVEDEGQCVYPMDCLKDRKDARYLRRIIL